MPKYAISSPANWTKFVETGDSAHLNDVDVDTLKSGDEIIVSCEGVEVKITVLR